MTQLLLILGVDTEKANPDATINLSMPNVFGRGEKFSVKCELFKFNLQ